MTHGSLFSGIGGFDLASEWMGWENVFHCEWNEFGKKVLKYYWPNAISYDDITKTDFTIHRGTIDILTGGFPCQPFSMAGKRKGTEDDRHLWPEMLRAIREIQPRYVVGENVPGLINWDGGLVFEQVQADLENEGYEVTPFVLPASGVNAPHRRDRVWFVAYSVNNRYKPGRGEISKENEISGISRETLGAWQFNGTSISFGFNSNSDLLRPDDLTPTQGQQHGIGRDARGESASFGECGDTTNTFDLRLQGGELNRSIERTGTIQGESRQPFRSVCNQWGKFPTQPPVCGRNDGLSSKLVGITVPKHRNESIKGYGNAIVPQVVYQIYKAIEQFNTK